MQYSDLYPPGEIYWLTRADDIVLPTDMDVPSKPRLFKVTGKVDQVFGQMIFTKTMLSSHLPHE